MAGQQRNKKGKFIECSPYGKKNISTRLPKSDEEKLLKQSEKLGLSPAEIARIAIAEWLAKQERIIAKS